MLIIRILGGLGNQMFQYAFGCRLKELGHTVVFDLEDFGSYKLHQGFELERVFGIRLEQASTRQLRPFRPLPVRLLHKLNMKYLFATGKFLVDGENFSWQKLKTGKNAYLHGYWQSLDYLPKDSSLLRNLFSFKTAMDPSRDALINSIKAEQSVSVHVRLGDYLDKENQHLFGNICTAEYYKKAMLQMEQLVPNPVYYVFSDDPEKARTIISSGFPLHFVEQNTTGNSYLDMYLMHLCKHNIIANSSFSWWAAWLNPHAMKKVIAPARWKNINDRTSLVPPDWIKL